MDTESKPIPFVNAQQSSYKALSGAMPIAMNIVADSRGCVRRRPGIAEIGAIGTGPYDPAGIIGVYVTEADDFFAVGGASPGSNVYWSPSVLNPAINNIQFIGVVDGGQRPTFAETEMLLVIAAGSYPKKIILTTKVVDLLGGDPPSSTHVISQSLRLLLNDVLVDRTKVRYSDQAIGTTDYSGHETWTPGANTAGFFTAEARPDPVVALAENTNEVFVFGSRTLQVMAPDANLVYSPVATHEYGCSAPYSIIKLDDGFAWLDHKRRFVRSDGRSIARVGGDAVNNEVDLAPDVTVSDCIGYRAQLGTMDALCWRLPTDGRTFVYQEGVGWGQWSGWDGGYAPCPISALHQSEKTGQCIVGTTAGQVGVLSFAEATDMGDEIPAHITTGFVDRGSHRRKQCLAVHVTLQRGHVPADPENPGKAFLEYRDHEGAWSSPLIVALGPSGDYEQTVTFRSLGAYRARQWRFTFDSGDELVLVKAEEEFGWLPT